MYLRYVNDEVKVIYVKFNDQNAGQQAIQSDIFARQRNWVPIQKYETTFLIKKNKLQPSIKRTQFPLVLSWSFTVHKVQGLSLSDGVISYELQRQKSFNQGQMYVAMSRISKLENIHLIGNYNRNSVRVNKSAKKEYERLYSECLLSSLSFPKASNDTLTIALLNRRSLRRHSEDILSDVDLMQNDILCLTETQLYLNEDTTDITTKFHNNFLMYYNSSTDKHRSIAFGYSSNIFPCESSNFCSMSLVNVKKSTFLDKPVKVALLYRPPNSPSLFLQNMKSWIDEKNLLLGDFNINALCTDSYSNLRHMLTNYKLLVSKPTHLDGALLDHVYIADSSSGHKKTVVIKNIFFQTMMRSYFTLTPTKTMM